MYNYSQKTLDWFFIIAKEKVKMSECEIDIALNKVVMDKVNTRATRLDFYLLDDNLAQAWDKYRGNFVYVTPFLRAARLCAGLVKSKRFANGDKNLALLLAIVYLSKLNIFIGFEKEDFLQVGNDILHSRKNILSVAEWLESHQTTEEHFLRSTAAINFLWEY